MGFFVLEGELHTSHSLRYIGWARQVKERQRNRNCLVRLPPTGRTDWQQPAVGMQLALCRVKLLVAMSLGCLRSWENLSRMKVRNLKAGDWLERGLAVVPYSYTVPCNLWELELAIVVELVATHDSLDW